MANQIEGLDKLQAQLESLKHLDVEKIGTVGYLKLLQGATDRCPVKTGYLRSTGEVEGVPDQGANLTYTANYAYYVEMNKRPWIRPTIDEDSDLIIQAMKDEAEKQIKEAIK